MIETVLGIYGRSPAALPRDADPANVAAELRRRKWIVFLTITFGYGFYYICRLSFRVARKPMVDAGVFNAAEMGMIGSALFFSYAFGKLANGMLADRVNVRPPVFQVHRLRLYTGGRQDRRTKRSYGCFHREAFTRLLPAALASRSSA
jgi:MFS family permease